jgi:PAS domain S-box-containing protein
MESNPAMTMVSEHRELIESLKEKMGDVAFFLPENVINFMDMASCGVVITNKDRKIVFMNRKARELLQYDIDEVIGCRCRKILRNRDCNTENCPITRSLEDGREVTSHETYYLGKNGNIVHAKTSVLILRDREGNVSGGMEIFNDITLFKALEEELDGKNSFGNIIGKSHQMQEMYQLIEEVAPTTSSVLITGESGTGKELIADAIHRRSLRSSGPHVKVNCGALAVGLLESELFGHVKGAFTGAIADKIGRFQMADGGTIFLDEIGDMSLSTQVKLLRVLQEGEFEKVGGSRTIKIDVRVIAATNRELKSAIAENLFRQDLYYRLNVVNIHVPPLRERKIDIPLLVDFFIKRLARKMPQKRIEGISQDVLDLLMEYDFPGNVRELENIIEHSFVRCQGDTITLEYVPKAIVTARNDIVTKALEEEYPMTAVERELLTKLLDNHAWNYHEVAKRLGVSRTTLWRKLKKLGISKKLR